VRASFDRIVVIFTPQSSGDGPQLAEQLHAELTRRLPEVPVHLSPTTAGDVRRMDLLCLTIGDSVDARSPVRPLLHRQGLTPVMPSTWGRAATAR